MVKSNPQLKSIILTGNASIDMRPLLFVVQHLPQIEKIVFNFDEIPRLIELDVKLFGRLRNLHTFDLRVNMSPTNYIVAAVHEMGDADIPLKQLKLDIMMLENVPYFFAGISKLNHLEHLVLKRVIARNTTHMHNICELLSLSELSVLVLGLDYMLTPENMLHLSLFKMSRS